MTHNQQLIYNAIRRAAVAGRLCPSNEVLCTITGMRSKAHISDTVTLLAKRGMFKVVRYSNSRQVFFDDCKTATPEYTTPHPRYS